MLFLYVEAFVTDIHLADECHYLVEDVPTFIYRHVYVNFFLADDWTGMNAEIIERKV